MTRLVQIQSATARRVALVEEPHLRLLAPQFASVHALASAALAAGTPLTAFARAHLTAELLDYDIVSVGRAAWRLLVPADHPAEPARCLVSGTGLTHLGSAQDRQAMHAATAAETDSMKMFRWGVEGGRPALGQ